VDPCPYLWYVAVQDRSQRRALDESHRRLPSATDAATGRIHSAGDHGPNPAAEIAMQVAARHRGHAQGEAK
jgi:hypothetical protein